MAYEKLFVALHCREFTPGDHYMARLLQRHGHQRLEAEQLFQDDSMIGNHHIDTLVSISNMAVVSLRVEEIGRSRAYIPSVSTA